MRNIAILRDGYSDYLVIKKFLQCLFGKHKSEILSDASFIDLESLNIVNPLTKYLDKASKKNDYTFHSVEANDLIKELISIYYGCYNRFYTEFDSVTNKEIIIVNADAERLLNDRATYFVDWAYNVKSLINLSIERFYEEMVKQGYPYESLPFIIPLILFPSSEILVASCIYDITKERLRSLTPNPGLKTKVYGTHSINEAITNGDLPRILEEYLVEEKLEEIYKEIPEARMLMHSLSS